MDDAHVLQALDTWYAGNPHVRRACAFRAREGRGAREQGVLHVLLDVEPVMDSDENLPVWLANSRTWESQLEEATGCSILLGDLQGAQLGSPQESGMQPFMLDIWLREDWGT